MKHGIRIIALLAAAALVMTAAPVMAASLGPHALLTGDPNPCKMCHDTASGTPALRGWAGAVAPLATGWGAKNISALCYGCHDAGGGYITGQTASPQHLNAFDDTNGSHFAVIQNAPEEPEGSGQGTQYPDIPTSSLPYTNAGAADELQCTSCHNVHVVTNRPFNQRVDYQTLCDECHGGRVNDGMATQATPGGTRPYSTHPTQVAMAGPSGNRNMMTEATMAGNMAVNTNAPAAYPGGYVLGGHLDSVTIAGGGATGNVTCHTCHAVHGPTDGTAGVLDLLAINNVTEAAGVGIGSALCEGCHYGGAAGGGTIAGGGVGTYDANLAGGEWPDHPLDARPANQVAMRGLISPPLNWMAATPNLDRGAQPHLAIGTPACSSCHDTHGGIENTPLLRGPAPALYGANAGGSAWAFDYDDWCFACHTPEQVIPPNHHSVVNNLATSQLGCGDCHGVGTTTVWTAHNGFWAFAIPLSATDSAFCEGCHTPVDPPQPVAGGLKGTQAFTTATTGTATYFDTLPATHGVIRDGGSGSSHYVNDIGADSPNPNMVADFTAVVWSSGGTSEDGGGQTVLCESCHNILVNGVPQAYGSAAGLTAGWQANLLLQPYEDDLPGVGTGEGANDFYGDTTLGAGATGEGFCRGCHNETGAGGDFVHNPDAHTRAAGYTYPVLPDGTASQPYGRPSNTILTDVTTACPDHTTADAGSSSATQPDGVTTSALPAAPGGLSYPAAGDVDCDSCHRPHNADVNSYDATGTVGDTRWLILEITDANWGTTICAECHDTEVQCL